MISPGSASSSPHSAAACDSRSERHSPVGSGQSVEPTARSMATITSSSRSATCR
ncbi:hypothetical protein [Nonomuraea rubra]|uniref:hypothetical protein n=1 Tax=Nonomuraea rubra TaxID=46180 RepID=UPI0033D4DDA9